MSILNTGKSALTVKDLGNIDFDELMDCFLLAFENYFVKMPTERNYYRERWRIAKVDYKLSYGMFDKEKLVGFIINAVDTRNGALTAYNTGTGVIPEYRGLKIVRSIYKYALPDLKRNGIVNCSLEVITTNEIAIRSYQSIGFEIFKKYKCYNGTINLENRVSVGLEEKNYHDINWEILPGNDCYCWDNQKETIREGNFRYFQVLNDNTPESFFAINPENGYLAQFDLLTEGENAWERLFSGIRQISGTIKINNVDVRLTNKINFLNSIGLVNSVDQYEMGLKINGGSLNETKEDNEHSISRNAFFASRYTQNSGQ
ncbi:MAG: GNAT family N-acetyltransferase [Gillisia sp.]